MATKPRGAKDPRPLYAKLPISLHVALQELATKRLRKTGTEVNQKELLEEAIRRLVEAEGIDLSQIEEDVSKWNPQQRKLARISTIPRKRGRKPS
jgi:hypothetical protein